MTGSTLVHAISSDQFDKVIQEQPIVFIDFWAEWCAPCKQFAKVYEAVASTYSDIRFASVNIAEQTELADALSIRSIPHLMVFKEGIAIYSEAGSMPESTLRELAEQAKAVDMAPIRQQLESDGE